MPKKSVERNIKPNTSGAVQKLELLFLVVDRNKTEFYVDFLQSFEINLQFMMSARGTAKDDMLDYLGLANKDKAVIINVIREDQVADALSALEEKFHTIRNGKGIAFTVPLTSTIGVAIYQFLSNNKLSLREESR